MRRCPALWSIAVLLLAGCGDPRAEAAAEAPGSVHAWVLPATPGARAPDLRLAPDGRLLLAWLDAPAGRRPAVKFAALTAEGIWQSQPRTVAVGQSLAVDAADPPRVLATADGALWMHWTQQTGEAGRSLALVRSRDGGMQWSEPVRVDDGEGIAAAAAVWPHRRDGLGIAWLQRGRDGTPTAVHGARYDLDLLAAGRATVDAEACTDGPLAVAMTARGALIAYRDQAAGPARDIAVARTDGSAWASPHTVHSDGWAPEACPQQPPAVAAHDAAVLIGWTTEAGGVPKVQLARSSDGGDAFAAPVRVDAGPGVLGRVAVALDDRQAWVAWLRAEARGASLQLARYTPDLSRKLQQVEVARLQGAATAAPVLAARAGDVWLVWTEVVDGVPDLAGARVSGERPAR